MIVSTIANSLKGKIKSSHPFKLDMILVNRNILCFTDCYMTFLITKIVFPISRIFNP